MRVTDPIGGPPNLELYFRNYAQHFEKLRDYSYHLTRLIAGYSRGDGRDELCKAFSVVVEHIAMSQKDQTEKFGPGDLVFLHKGKYVEPFRNALVVLSFALTLRAGEPEISTILASCERGDPLLEMLIATAAPDLQQPPGAPAFHSYFDLLYDALSQAEPQREDSLAQYLAVWYTERMEGFSFKDRHLERDDAGYVGYWCIEAAGVVAALGIDDSKFSSHPHYPKDLVAFYRQW